MRTLLASLVALVVFVLVAGCLDLPSSPDLPPPLRVVSVTSPAGALDMLGRLPVLRVRFDHPLPPPSADAVLLVTGDPSDTLRADAARASLPPTLGARRVPAELTRDPEDPTVLVLRATAALLPDTSLVLLVTPRVHGPESTWLSDGDGGTRAEQWVLQVAPARRCGPLAVATVPEGVAGSPGRFSVRFDRPVHILRPGTAGAVTLAVDGSTVGVRWSLDCVDPDGLARCAWILPEEPPREGARGMLHLGALADRDGLPVENTPVVVFTRRRLSSPDLGTAPVCAMDETVLGRCCLRVGDGWIELRATTPVPAVIRATVVASEGATVHRSALSDPGALQSVRVTGLRPATPYVVSVAVVGADGALAPRTEGWTTTRPALPSVRITEVLARPRGAHTQAYVELANDGDTEVSVGGWTLHFGPKDVALPDGAMVPARGRAVVVGAEYDPRGIPAAGDPSLTPGTPVIAVPGTLSAHGLRSTGADVALRDPTGTLASFVPGADPRRAPRPGVGLVRAELDLPDADPAAWSWDARGGCTPGAPDRLR